MTDYDFDTAVISFCTINHADVWRLTSQGIPGCLPAEKYLVYVPTEQVTHFKDITDSKIEVLSEDMLGDKFRTKLFEACAKAGNAERFNWYFQQFLKIESLVSIGAKKLIIWDADCVPVKPINFFGSTGKPKYMMSKEFHKDYFTNLKILLNLDKINDSSFIAAGFPILKKWVLELIAEIEFNNSVNKWWDALISSIDFSKMSGFSEFETIGTWIQFRHGAEIEFQKINWERFGQSKFGLAKSQNYNNLVTSGLNLNLDVISFENWDELNRGKSKATLNFFKNFTKRF